MPAAKGTIIQSNTMVDVQALNKMVVNFVKRAGPDLAQSPPRYPSETNVPSYCPL